MPAEYGITALILHLDMGLDVEIDCLVPRRGVHRATIAHHHAPFCRPHARFLGPSRTVSHKGPCSRSAPPARTLSEPGSVLGTAFSCDIYCAGALPTRGCGVIPLPLTVYKLLYLQMCF